MGYIMDPLQLCSVQYDLQEVVHLLSIVQY